MRKMVDREHGVGEEVRVAGILGGLGPLAGAYFIRGSWSLLQPKTTMNIFQFSVSVRYLDETTLKEAVETPQTYRSRERAVASDGGGVRLELLPYAVATVVYKWGNCHT
jgi:hypothetical protein